MVLAGIELFQVDLETGPLRQKGAMTSARRPRIL